MTNKVINFERDALSKIISGVDILANSVKVTMGPSGKNVVIENIGRAPTLTKDGVTVAKAVNLSDRFKNIGVQVVKEAASQSAEIAGDGTTTATVLAQALCRGGVKLMSAGYNFSEIKLGMEKSLPVIKKSLLEMSKAINNHAEIVDVATISANGEKEIATMIADAIDKVGTSGALTVEEARGFASSLDIVEGSQIYRGYVSPYFINDPKGTCTFEDARILLCNCNITSMNQILPVLEHAHKKGSPLFIMCDDIDGEVLKTIVMNVSKGILKACVIKSPEFGNARHSAMKDLSVLLKCDVITNIPDGGIPYSIKMGSSKKIICSSDKSIIIIENDEENEELKFLKDDLSQMLEDELTSEEQKIVVKRRLNRISSRVAVLRVGGSTELELKERKDRVDDSISATRAAISEGILPGGGVSLIRCITSLEKLIKKEKSPGVKAGIKNVVDCLKVPFKQIINNTGTSSEVILEKVINSNDKNYGWDSRQGEYVNMIEAGILDPHKVVRISVENAISVACNLISIGCAMVHDDEEVSSNSPLFSV